MSFVYKAMLVYKLINNFFVLEVLNKNFWQNHLKAFFFHAQYSNPYTITVKSISANSFELLLLATNF